MGQGTAPAVPCSLVSVPPGLAWAHTETHSQITRLAETATFCCREHNLQGYAANNCSFSSKADRGGGEQTNNKTQHETTPQYYNLNWCQLTGCQPFSLQVLALYLFLVWGSGCLGASRCLLTVYTAWVQNTKKLPFRLFFPHTPGTMRGEEKGRAAPAASGRVAACKELQLGMVVSAGTEEGLVPHLKAFPSSLPIVVAQSGDISYA